MDAIPPPKPKIKQKGAREASSQAHSYAQNALSDLHDDEVWALAERLDNAMKQIAKQYIAAIRGEQS